MFLHFMLYSIAYKIFLIFVALPLGRLFCWPLFLIFFNSFTLYVLCVCIIVIMCTFLCPYINIVLEVLSPQNVYSLYCGWICTLYDVFLRQCTFLWPSARRPSADSASVGCAQAEHCFCLLQGQCHHTHSYFWEFHGYCGQAVSR